MERLIRYLSLLSAVLKTFFKQMFFSDTGLISQEVSEILSNPEDTKKYKEAIKKVEETNSNVTITLSNNKTITLVN